MVSTLQLHKIQMWITRGRVLNEELYAQRFHRLIHLHLFTEYFMKIYPQALERFWPLKRNVQEFETVCKQMQLNQLLKSLYTPITAVIDIHAPQEKLFSSRAYDWWDIAWYLFHHCTGMWIKHCIILQYQMMFDGCSAVKFPMRWTVQSCWQSEHLLFCFTQSVMQQLWKEWLQSPHTTTQCGASSSLPWQLRQGFMIPTRQIAQLNRTVHPMTTWRLGSTSWVWTSWAFLFVSSDPVL